MRSPILILICALLLASCSTRIRFDEAKSGCNADQINLNSATEKELVELPGIGGPTAKLILDFRSTNGKFRRPEQVLLIRGMSESRFLEFRSFLCAE